MLNSEDKNISDTKSIRLTWSVSPMANRSARSTLIWLQHRKLIILYLQQVCRFACNSAHFPLRYNCIYKVFTFFAIIMWTIITYSLAKCEYNRFCFIWWSFPWLKYKKFLQFCIHYKKCRPQIQQIVRLQSKKKIFPTYHLLRNILAVNIRFLGVKSLWVPSATLSHLRRIFHEVGWPGNLGEC